MKPQAVVLVSGGLDSATTLAIAREDGCDCHCLSIDYGQRHRSELDAAARVAQSLGAVAHKVVRIDLGADVDHLTYRNAAHFHRRAGREPPRPSPNPGCAATR